MRIMAVGAVLVLLCAERAAAQSRDALDETLALVGLQRPDLGWTPKGWWPRYPADIPYKLRAFDALFAEPLDTVAFTRGLAQAAWERLDPAALDKEQERGSRNLYHAVQRLGIDPKFGGFRGYTANVLAPEMPLDKAIIELYRAAHRTTKPNTFAMELPYPRIEEQLAEKVKVLPEGVSPILGQLVLNIIDAHYWVELAFRNVDARARQVVATRYNTGEEMIDAFDYCPAFDDVARTWDEASMWYAAQKCVDALDLARIKLQTWLVGRTAPIPEFECDWETPWGWIRVRGGARDMLDGTDALLLVDLAGAETYLGPVAAGGPATPLSLCLDLAGDDRYNSARRVAQGCGLTGIGVLLDAAGDDGYLSERCSQGMGQFGLGLLADLAGDDQYSLKISGQGCGYFGVGLLFDIAGNDQYRIWADGQGLGGVAGVGVLADRSGNDRYVAERKASVTGRTSYHSPNNDVGVSNVQGCGMGRRGDGADGHCWAGGLGALLDGEGNDYYSAGNWSMGTGYWFGIGLLHDHGGDDEYHGVVWSQGSGAHFCIGACIDEGGNDQHLCEENANNSIAFAHDFTIGLLLNIGGNDVYAVEGSGLGGSINRSVAMLIDIGGDDTYRSKSVQRPGYAVNSEGFRARDGVSTYFADTTSLGLFLDIGGEDAYALAAPASAPAEMPPGPADNSRWLDPLESPNWADRNFSVGVDRADGQVSFTPRPVRPPAGRPPAGP